VRVEVKEKHPFDGPLVLRVDGNERTIGSTVAHQVFVQRFDVTDKKEKETA
jgi:Fe2+ transport system protein FeoA